MAFDRASLSLTSLPNELLYMITNDLDIASASKLSRTCISFHQALKEHIEGEMARQDALPLQQDYYLIQQKLSCGENIDKHISPENIPEENMAWAVKWGRLDFLERYLTAGVDPNSYTLSGKPMISYAACEGQVESARTLLHYGADPCLRNRCGGQTPLGYAVCGTFDKSRRVAMIELLLRAGAKITSLEHFRLICYIPEDPESLVRLAVRNGREFLALRDRCGQTVLHKVVRYSADLTALILEAAPELLHERTSDGKTALHVAVEHGYEAAARYLIARNEITNEVDSHGQTALHIAVRRDLTTVKFFTSCPNVKLNMLSGSNESPLALAISYHLVYGCYFDIIDHLLRHPRIHIDPHAVRAIKHISRRKSSFWTSGDVLLLLRFVWVYAKQEGYFSHFKICQALVLALLTSPIWFAYCPFIVDLIGVGFGVYIGFLTALYGQESK
ncbi:hypothetical protein APSETT445_005460 [Aspergillus pseudonomiae]